MDKKAKIYFVFPVFNESLNIPRLANDLEELEVIVSPISMFRHFIFVDDGSTDGTASQLREIGRHNLTVLSHQTNLGPGAAFQTAFSHLIAMKLAPNDLVITLEGDATSDPAILIRMLKRLDEGDDIILASPYLYGGGFSGVKPFRVFLSHVANFLFKLILNVHGLATFSCFFRIYRGSALLQLNSNYPNAIITSKGFDCAAEIIVKAVRSRLTISEVPFKVDWSRRKGRSKMKIIKTSIAYLKLFFKYSFAKRVELTNENFDHHRS